MILQKGGEKEINIVRIRHEKKVVLVNLLLITGRGGGTGGRLGIKKRQRPPRPVSNSPKYISSQPQSNKTNPLPLFPWKWPEELAPWDAVCYNHTLLLVFLLRRVNNQFYVTVTRVHVRVHVTYTPQRHKWTIWIKIRRRTIDNQNLEENKIWSKCGQSELREVSME